MAKKTDGQLLREFASTRSEAAFAELLGRHGRMVYNACLRALGSPENAEDAAQACFAILARKAKGFARHADVGGWLHKVAVQVALNLRKSEARRRAREKEAGEAMRKRSSQAGPGWEQVSGELDVALARLSAAQREAVVGVYLEGRTRAEVADSLGVPDGTVAWRCQAGLEKLRRLLGRGGVSLGAAALGSMLLESGASAAPPASFSTLPSLCASFAAKGAAGSAGSSAIALAEGTMKAMTMTKIKIAAAVICAATVFGGGGTVAVRKLVAGETGTLPAPRALNPKVAAMKDNTWVKLPTPKVYPRSRTSSPWMVYAPSLGRAFMWGASAGNASTTNDLWDFDLAAVRWRQLLKAEPGVKTDPKVLKIKDNVLMTRGEKPLGGHQWGSLDYDPDRKVIWHLPLNFPRQGSKNMFHDVKAMGGKLGFTLEDCKKADAALKGPVLWKYDVAKNKWSWVHTRAPGFHKGGRVFKPGYARDYGTIRYCPPLRKLVMIPGGSDPIDHFRAYDPEANEWSLLNVTPKSSAAGGKGLPKYWFRGRTCVTVYDSKRKQFIIVCNGNGTWVMDPVRKTLELVIPVEKTLPANLDGPVGGFVYDAVGERVLGIFVNYGRYNMAKTLKARGFPVDRANVWTLDLEKKQWVLQPKPSDGVLPQLDQDSGNVHHFYDPVNNATFVFRGNYNRKEECWVYRYKRAKK